MRKRPSGAAPWLAWELLAISALMMAASFLLTLIAGRGSESDSPLDSTIFGFGFLLFAAVGALIASRRPENAVGWIFLTWGLIWSLQSISVSYGSFALSEHLPGALVAAWMANWTIAPAFYGFVFLALVFPDGKVLTRRWRVVWWLGAAGAGCLTLGAAFAPGPLVDQFKEIQNPFGLSGSKELIGTLQGIGWAFWMPANAAAAISLIVRYWRSGREHRLQLKWFALAGAFLAFAFLLSALSYGYGTQLKFVSEILILLALPSVPIAAGIAILKYRLYDIDVVINKTLVYAALAAFITLIYVGVVVGIGSLVGAGDKPNLGLSLAATAIVAVAFQPVRERVQRFANKLVYGERVTPYEAVTSFSHRMAESLTLDQVLPQMAEAAAKGVGGNRSRVKLFFPGGGEQMVAWPTDSAANSFDKTLKVAHQGEQVGEIAVAKAPGEQITKSEEKLLSDLASQAGLVMRNLRLTGELQQKLIELQESRKRIVKVQDEERRRIERDIHDGAQQQLVAMAVKLGLAKSLAARDPEKASEVLDQLRAETQEAIETVRDLARGLFPGILVERGLAEAISSHISKMEIDARVESEIGDARFDLEVEANVYFCIREALQNASKHAFGASIVVRLYWDGDRFVFSVIDEGPGFDPNKVKLGSGLQNMSDRVEALGGSFEIDSRPGAGTRITGRVPAPIMSPMS